MNKHDYYAHVALVGLAFLMVSPLVFKHGFSMHSGIYVLGALTEVALASVGHFFYRA